MHHNLCQCKLLYIITGPFMSVQFPLNPWENTFLFCPHYHLTPYRNSSKIIGYEFMNGEKATCTYSVLTCNVQQQWQLYMMNQTQKITATTIVQTVNKRNILEWLPKSWKIEDLNFFVHKVTKALEIQAHTQDYMFCGHLKLKQKPASHEFLRQWEGDCFSLDQPPPPKPPREGLAWRLAWRSWVTQWEVKDDSPSQEGAVWRVLVWYCSVSDTVFLPPLTTVCLSSFKSCCLLTAYFLELKIVSDIVIWHKSNIVLST